VSTGTIAELVRDHIMSTRPPEKRSLDLTDSSSLVSTGILDSVGVFDLVAFLEARFGIHVADEELEWKTFETVDTISQFVESKLARGADVG
jgi:acyl carrier protein